jgi:hypothetical protein
MLGRLAGGLCLLLLLGCGQSQPEKPAPKTAEAPVTTIEAAPLPKLAPEALTVSVLRPDELNALEGALGLHAILGAPQTEETQPSTAWMTANINRWSVLAEALGARVASLAGEVERDLVVEHKDALAWPAGNVGRRLDPRWLNASMAFFDLAAVVNRLDRRDFAPESPCGEVRLIYRLAYQLEKEGGTTVSSRLPVTLNAVMRPQCAEGPQAYARSWALPESSSAEGRAAALLEGPLNPETLRLHKLEVNAQVVRFPSGLETEFAGQAMYLLRVYRFAEDDGLMEVPLENTPDVARLREDPALKSALLDWVRANVQAIDQGVYQLPEPLLATEALSWSTLGINRSANKPFSALFPAAARSELPAAPEGSRWIASEDALVDRLDNGSCMGCHQASTTAGFHLLGRDDPAISGVTNRLQLPFSAHFQAEQPRRTHQLAAIANGEGADSYRPHSLVTGLAQAPTNGNCIPDAHREAFRSPAGLRCAGEQRCEVLVKDPGTALHFGQCMPAQEALKSGNTCRVGAVTPSSTPAGRPFNLHAYADTLSQRQHYELPENKQFAVDSYNCRPTVIGVPLGRAYRKCSPEERGLTGMLGEVVNEEICAVVGGSRFDSCVEKDFHTCLNKIVGRGMVSSCHSGHFCREDYICQALPYQLEGVPAEAGKAVADAGVGFCTPTYFVFQLRLDGHPVPGE